MRHALHQHHIDDHADDGDGNGNDDEDGDDCDAEDVSDLGGSDGDHDGGNDNGDDNDTAHQLPMTLFHPLTKNQAVFTESVQ
ncbi:unnamed protein product [Haemonchus placei]|uniref:Uncharacterized protein n=1 Tax=Haemonchus placei TaxID=6290 RepID=A0A0N4WJL5_HAEPC|nr:unnamed protein product [Haemonchus placei]